MNHLSRRTFIGGAAAGVAAVTVAAVPGLAAAAAPSQLPDDNVDDTAELAGPVVARVRDLRTGEITLYAGTEEISYTDRTLARRLARAAAR
ncbi:MAG: twin-arginine translocation signal domain-containing protein [Acidimicrobiales bacterium]